MHPPNTQAQRREGWEPLVRLGRKVLISAEGAEIPIKTMSRISAGLLMYRVTDGQLQVLLAHPGGPFFKNKDDGAWSIPKGEIESGEELLAAAIREFHEETGLVPTEPFTALTSVKLKSGKIVHGWAFEGDCDPESIASNTFTVEWPPRSGMQQEFPEIDRAGFFNVEEAKRKLNPSQIPLISELERIIGDQANSPKN